MADVLDMVMSKEDQAEIKELISMWVLLPKEDRAVLLSNANAFRVRSDIDKAMREQQDEPLAVAT